MAKGKIAALILERMKPGEGKGDSGGGADGGDGKDEAGPDQGLEAAMSELASALKDDDPKAAAAAFRSAHEICAGYEGGSGE
jgi:hypothetical protein